MPVKRILGVGMAAAVFGAGALSALASPASATTFTPTPDPTVDGNAMSLRAAVTAAVSNGDVIDLQAGGTYTLDLCSPGELTHGNTSLTISTPSGAPATIRQTCVGQRVLSQGTGTLTLNNVVITGGNLVGGFFALGGGIGASGSVTVTNSMLVNNSTTSNGGFFAAGGGGAISADGTVSVTNTTLANNTATATGGDFTTEAGGGAINARTVTLTNSTVTANTATAGNCDISCVPSALGGGIRAAGLTTIYATVVSNNAPTGANVDLTGSGTLTSFGSVLALPQGGGTNCADLAGTTSNGFNFSDDASAGVSCHFNNPTDSVSSGNTPTLGALADNGGPTQTLLPLSGSPLVDGIPFAHCSDGNSLAGFTIVTDQRLLGRPSPPGGACDVGAVEIQVAGPAPTAAPAGVVITPRFTG